MDIATYMNIEMLTINASNLNMIFRGRDSIYEMMNALQFEECRQLGSSAFEGRCYG